MSVFIVERNLNKGASKMTGKNHKGGFFNTFSGALKTVFDVLHRKRVFYLENFKRFSAPISTVLVPNSR